MVRAWGPSLGSQAGTRHLPTAHCPLPTANDPLAEDVRAARGTPALPYRGLLTSTHCNSPVTSALDTQRSPPWVSAEPTTQHEPTLVLLLLLLHSLSPLPVRQHGVGVGVDSSHGASLPLVLGHGTSVCSRAPLRCLARHLPGSHVHTLGPMLAYGSDAYMPLSTRLGVPHRSFPVQTPPASHK